LTARAQHWRVRSRSSPTRTRRRSTASDSVVRIAKVLREFGHDVAIVAPRYPATQVWTRRSCASRPRPSAVSAIRLSLPQFAAVARFLDPFEPDVVHVATEARWA